MKQATDGKRKIWDAGQAIGVEVGVRTKYDQNIVDDIKESEGYRYWTGILLFFSSAAGQ